MPGSAWPIHDLGHCWPRRPDSTFPKLPFELPYNSEPIFRCPKGEVAVMNQVWKHSPWYMDALVWMSTGDFRWDPRIVQGGCC